MQMSIWKPEWVTRLLLLASKELTIEDAMAMQGFRNKHTQEPPACLPAVQEAHPIFVPTYT
jgi:hypothetical protein